jgi:HK97 gp10 family phage protein
MTINWVQPTTGNSNRGGTAVGTAAVKVDGLQELLTALEKFPDAVAKKVIFRALSDSARVIVAAARAAAPVRSGVLKRSIRQTTVKKGRIGPVLLIQIGGKKTIVNRKTKMKREEDAYYAPWVEFGAKEHDIVAPLGKKLAFAASGSVGRGRAYQKVKHPGTKATGFFGRAIDHTAQRASNTFESRVEQLLSQASTFSSLVGSHNFRE